MVDDSLRRTPDLPAPPDEPGQFILYQTEDGRTRVEVRIFRETVWLSQKAMAELFQKDVRTINEHIHNVFAEGELREPAVIRKFRITASDGKQYDTLHYNLDAIISVGYRVKSHRGTQFRIWATQRLREYLIKGYTLDDQRLKQAGGGNYFDELLARIRDIRSSEKVFWRKVLDIYAMSIDYDPNADLSREFFATVQNKMHWAAHGHTAAEIISRRADAAKPYMGLTAWMGDKPRRYDIAVAKNYLNKEELEALNLIVSFYLDFAELQARGRKPMYMRDWIAKLDDFLRLSERDILTHAGEVSRDDALAKARLRVFENSDIAFDPKQHEHECDIAEALRLVRNCLVHAAGQVMKSTEQGKLEHAIETLRREARKINSQFVEVREGQLYLHEHILALTNCTSYNLIWDLYNAAIHGHGGGLA